MFKEELKGITDFEAKSLRNIDSKLFKAELLTAIDHIRRYIETYSPDCIILTGSSPQIVIAILDFLNIPAKFKVLNWGTEINGIVYKTPELEDSDRESQLDSILRSRYPELSSNSKLLFIDDFSDTGSKAQFYKDRLSAIGYSKVKFATIATSRDNVAVEEGGVDTSGSNEANFSHSIRVLSLFISFSRNNVEGSQTYKYYADLYLTKFMNVLRSLNQEPFFNRIKRFIKR